MNKVNYFGFYNHTGKMVISDPSHKFEFAYEVPLGHWEAIVNYTPEGRIKSVRVEHAEHKSENNIKVGTINVDSGQIVFCDNDIYQCDKIAAMVIGLYNWPKMDWPQHSLFYNLCSYQSLTEQACGSIHDGFVTSTGGDGTFTLLGEFKDNSEEYEKKYGRLYTAFSIQFE